MRKLKKCLLLLMLAVFALGAAIPVQAKTETETRTEILYPPKDKWSLVPGEADKKLRNSVYIGSATEKITDLKSSNKAVASVTIKFEKDYGGYNVLANLKKPGITTITWKAKEDGKTKNYKVILKVKKYVNPIASVKLGNTTIKGTKFQNTSVYKVKYAQFAKKNIKVKITPAKGWSLPKSISFVKSDNLWKKINEAMEKGDKEKVKELKKKDRNLPKKPSFGYFGGYFMILYEHNGGSVKVSKKGFELYLDFINNKTKQEERVIIQFK